MTGFEPKGRMTICQRRGHNFPKRGFEVVAGTSFFFFLRSTGLRSQKTGTKEGKQSDKEVMEADAQSFQQFAETQDQFGRWLRHQRERGPAPL